MRGVYFVDFNPLDFCQLLDAALDLDGFSGFVAETLDEILCIGYQLLLVPVCTHLLFDTLLPQHYELGVVYGVVIYFAARYFDCSVGHIVDECAVVADKHDSFGIGTQETFEPLD